MRKAKRSHSSKVDTAEGVLNDKSSALPCLPFPLLRTQPHSSVVITVRRFPLLHKCGIIIVGHKIVVAEFLAHERWHLNEVSSRWGLPRLTDVA